MTYDLNSGDIEFINLGDFFWGTNKTAIVNTCNDKAFFVGRTDKVVEVREVSDRKVYYFESSDKLMEHEIEFFGNCEVGRPKQIAVIKIDFDFC
jgi:hypothetical protein